MGRKSIILKLFLLTTGLFTITFVLFFIGQTLFLEKFYLQKKLTTVKTAFETFVNDYSKSDQTYESVKKLKDHFYKQTNAQLILTDLDFNIKETNYYYMEVTDIRSKQKFYIPLNNVLMGKDYSSFMELNFDEGNLITIKGLRKRERLLPITIAKGNTKWRNNNIINDLNFLGIPWQESQKGFIPQNIIDISGVITKKILPAKGDLRTANIDTLVQGIQHWELNSVRGQSNPTVLTGYSFSEDTEGKNQTFIKPIIQNGDVTEYAFAMTSLQPVDEAMLVLKDYYLYALIIVFIVIILLSFYYSRIIAKPLIQMNKATKKMANFDFSEKLTVSSEDEIGSLSTSINTLSVNLKDRIDQLNVANEKLQKDVEQERLLERTRKEFISGVSHELKTPLSVIRSFAEGIKDGVSQNTDHYTNVILEEVDKMNLLIVDMLELAKLESGTYKLEMTTFSIGDLIHQVYTKLLFSIEEKQLQVHIDVDCSVYVEANRNRIEQVIVNLLSNATRYTPKGEEIHITSQPSESEIKICIRNTGNPIPQESLAKIWERFYRLDASRSRHTGGTGLGLSIVKNILELHGVSFGVENEENGVLFYFYLKTATNN
ncbi:sensor histidine kinase [Microbacteriaceae bacterium 4G12]